MMQLENPVRAFSEQAQSVQPVGTWQMWRKMRLGKRLDGGLLLGRQSVGQGHVEAELVKDIGVAVLIQKVALAFAQGFGAASRPVLGAQRCAEPVEFGDDPRRKRVQRAGFTTWHKGEEPVQRRDGKTIERNGRRSSGELVKGVDQCGRVSPRGQAEGCLERGVKSVSARAGGQGLECGMWLRAGLTAERVAPQPMGRGLGEPTGCGRMIKCKSGHDGQSEVKWSRLHDSLGRAERNGAARHQRGKP